MEMNNFLDNKIRNNDSNSLSKVTQTTIVRVTVRNCTSVACRSASCYACLIMRSWRGVQHRLWKEGKNGPTPG
uniref:Uncharacterized protein n=1 Tax=Trichogramma kaykai TaxID=54128 RepID=A0ABD2W8T9_9HYME